MSKQKDFSLATGYKERKFNPAEILLEAALGALKIGGKDVFDFSGPRPGPPEPEPKAFGNDSWATKPFLPSFAKRKKAYLEYSQKGDGNILSAISRYHLGHAPKLDQEDFQKRIDFINSRGDCADFELTRVLRALIFHEQNPEKPFFTKDQHREAKRAVLDFKYWVDQGGKDTMISWTENHMMLFHSLEFLAGQLYRDEVFSNTGKTGEWHHHHAKPYILDWIKSRGRFGFSEWDSNVYFEEDITPLLNLLDFSQDEEVKTLATMATDLMLADIAFDHFYGMFPTSKGRTYVEWNKWAWRYPLANVVKIAWGFGRFSDPASFGAVLLATSSYELPPVIEKIGQDMKSSITHKEQSGIPLTYAIEQLDWDPMTTDGVMKLAALGGYAEPEVIRGMVELFSRHGLWETDFVREAKPIAPLSRFVPLKTISEIVPMEPHRTRLDTVNKITVKNKDYMLSSAQDYKKGKAVNQQMIWIASLAPDAFIHVNNPGALSDQDRCPAYFGNDNRFPRVGQVGQVLISIYRIPKVKLAGERAIYLFTHAYFPKANFDEVLDRGPWTFARREEGYLALYASKQKEWTTSGREKDREIVVRGDRVVWVVHMGRKAEDGSFQEFQETILNNDIWVDPRNHNEVVYQAKGLGEIAYGWRSDLRHNGQKISQTDFPRFENPWCHQEWGTTLLNIKKESDELSLDFEKGTRTLSS